MNSTIRIHHTKKGRKVAYKIYRGRHYRMKLAEAETMISTGQVKEVIHGPKLNQPYAKIIDSWNDPNGVRHHKTAVVK